MKNIETLDEMFELLDLAQSQSNLQYLDSKMHSYLNIEGYILILKEVVAMKPRPKRVIDIGSNLNQYAFLFENEGIFYIGIDPATTKFATPYYSDMVAFIDNKYENVWENFIDDVIISNLCVGYLVPRESVKCKRLIVGQDLRTKTEREINFRKLWGCENGKC